SRAFGTVEGPTTVLLAMIRLVTSRRERGDRMRTHGFVRHLIRLTCVLTLIGAWTAMPASADEQSADVQLTMSVHDGPWEGWDTGPVHTGPIHIFDQLAFVYRIYNFGPGAA